MRLGTTSSLVVSVASTIAIVAAPAPSAAGTVAIAADADATLIENTNGEVANGAGPAFFVGRTSQASGSIRRALLRFDVAAHVPAEAPITDARLVLSATPSNPATAEVSLHRVLTPWTEGPSFASGGSGAPAEPGDVTWRYASFPAERWATPGGDFAGESSATVAVGDAGLYAWSGRGLRADVESWRDDPSGNHGWIVRGDESMPTTSKRFESRDAEDPSVRPVLVVEFGRSPTSCIDTGFTGAALGTCLAYCDASNCATDPTRLACLRLERRFATQSGGAALPCVVSDDADGDGAPDPEDNCPDVANADQLDVDGDHVGDVCDNCAVVANVDQRDTFGAIGVGDACDCPCFTAFQAASLAATLSDATVYEDLLCVDSTSAKPVTALSAVRADDAACATASRDCGLLAVEFTEDRACQWNPPVPQVGVGISGITDAQREACRESILAASVAAGLGCN